MIWCIMIVHMKRRKKLSRGELFLIFSVILGIMHHADHVLRADHSGWPFEPRIEPFTISLVFYPLFLSVYLAKKHPWYRVIVMAVIFLILQTLHIIRETPENQFHTWAYNSSDLPEKLGQSNLLNISSTCIGYISAGLSLVLSGVLILSIYYFYSETRRKKSIQKI